MKKFFIFIAMVIAFCSCEKFEVFNSNTCTVENRITEEELFGESLLNATSTSTQVIVYEVSAKSENEKYSVRQTFYNLDYGKTVTMVLDNRTKFVRVAIYGVCKEITEDNTSRTYIYQSTDFIAAAKDIHVKIDTTTLTYNSNKRMID